MRHPLLLVLAMGCSADPTDKFDSDVGSDDDDEAYTYDGPDGGTVAGGIPVEHVTPDGYAMVEVYGEQWAPNDLDLWAVIENVGGVLGAFVDLEATAYDADDNVIGEASRFVSGTACRSETVQTATCLFPGDQGFVMLYDWGDRMGDDDVIARITFRLDTSDGDFFRPDSIVEVDESSIEVEEASGGRVDISGLLRNPSDSDAKAGLYAVEVWVRDGDGVLVGRSFSDTPNEGLAIRAGETVPFTIQSVIVPADGDYTFEWRTDWDDLGIH